MVTDARIYDCTVRHVRREPVRNDFTYRSVMWLVDLDRLPRFPRALRMFAEFRAADHVGDPALSLRRNVDRYLAEQGVDIDGGRVLMLTGARAFGYVFNPITVYWCHAADGGLACVIAEVHNTYGGRHRYLLRTDELGRAETKKEFFVSPFYPASGHYRMSVPEPDDELKLSIRYEPPDGAPFAAVLRGRAEPATVAAMLRLAMRQPSSTLLGAARIRVQGIKLFLRGLPVVKERDVEH